MRNNYFYIAMIFFLFRGLLSPAQSDSKIVLYREHNYQASAISYKIFANDSLIIRIKNASYYVFDCLPGDYEFKVEKMYVPILNLKVEENKIYYLRFSIRTGMWTTMPELIVVDSISAHPVIYNGNLRELDKNNTPLIRPKSRIGINLGIGGGFENIPMIETTEGDDSKISFGGGIAIGLKYGREFSKHFDLAFDLNYQFGELRPVLDNADVTFSRGVLSVTPSYIVPLSDGETMRLKFGGGFNYYWSNSLAIETSEISGGFNDNWDYNSSTGFHLNAIFELNASEKWSFNYGFKWYTVDYEFKSGGNHEPTDIKLSNPNGSGIDFLFGAYYHF